MILKIGIIGDIHFGYKFGEERGEDSFKALEEALNHLKDCDLIIQAGDMFDHRAERQEVIARAAKLFGQLKNVQCNTKLIDLIGKDPTEIQQHALQGIPIVAIHGTHERRSKHLMNPVQALEHAGTIVYLNSQTAVFEIEGRKVAIHGLSGVPERFAKEHLQHWNPRPVPNAVNIFMMHQSIEPYIYSPLEPPSLKLEDLPSGMNLHVLGHMHWHDQQPLRGAQLLLTGSIIPTSVHKHESVQKKGVWKYDGNIIEFIPLSYQRRVYWEEFEYVNNLKDAISYKVNQILSQPHIVKPVVNIKIRGKLPRGFQLPDLSDIMEKFGDRGIINILSRVESEDFSSSVELLRLLREAKLSPEEQGLKILQANLDQSKSSIRLDDVFDLLVEGNTELVFNILTGKQATLPGVAVR